jgi:hypothetical protein
MKSLRWAVLLLNVAGATVAAGAGDEAWAQAGGEAVSLGREVAQTAETASARDSRPAEPGALAQGRLRARISGARGSEHD